MNQDKLDRYMNDDKYTRNAVILLGVTFIGLIIFIAIGLHR